MGCWSSLKQKTKMVPAAPERRDFAAQLTKTKVSRLLTVAIGFSAWLMMTAEATGFATENGWHWFRYL